MIVLVLLAVLAGGFTTAWVSTMVGIPPADAIQLALMAGGGALAAGAVGAASLHALRRRSIAAQSVVVAFAALGAVSVGALLAARGMFISTHDLAALVVVLFAAATVGLVIAFLLGRRVGAASRSLSVAARGVAKGEPRRFAAESEPLELASLARELDQMRVKLEETRARERAMDASRRELVAWVSHDLRTPLAGIRAIAEALEDGVVTDPETIERYYRTLRQETDRLAHLVDDLFELSRINAGALSLNFTPVPLAELVSDALAGAAALAENKGVKLEGAVAGSPVVEASVSEFSRVLHNLLENAVRYTPSEGSVSLQAGLAGGHAVVTVTDECGGIPETDLNRVFDLAFRGKAARTPGSDGGAGLGLAIARGIVEAHHGGIEVQNLAPGCRFTVRLPLTQPATA
ncbi:MAG: HAMP domain-containing sensor histidine kinase [Actinomycetota bacterium]